MSEASALQAVAIDTDASSSFVCEYVAGVNRVLSLPPYLLVDNIGRNFELWQFQPRGDQPIARAVYDLTSYPDDPVASLLDVDIHAAFLRPEGQELLAVNHYGRVRSFRLPAPGARMAPQWERQLLGDTERVVMAAGCFIASSPRGEYTDDPAQPGIFLFEPLAPMPNGARLACEQALANWGAVDALAVSATEDRLAVAGALRLAVFDLRHTIAGVRLGDCLWESPLTFHCQWLQFDNTDQLWVGGFRPPSSALAGDEWNGCLGGGVQSFAVNGGARQFSAELPEETAWGYGGDPVVLDPDCRALYVLGRDASLSIIDIATGQLREPYSALRRADHLNVSSLGIGHAAWREGRIYAGFSRGGFRLLRYDLSFAGTRDLKVPGSAF